MSTTQFREAASLDTIVDCDFHVTETQADVLPYLEGPYRDLLDVEGTSYLHNLYPSAGYITRVTTGHAEMDQIRSPEDVSEAMSLLNTDYTMLSPGMNLRLSYVHNDDLAPALASAYNSWLLDTLLDADDRFFGSILVAPQDPERAAEEIDRRAGEKNLKAVFVPSGGVMPLLGHDRFFPIYEAAESHGLPVMFHNSGNGAMANFPHHWRWTKRELDVHVSYHPAEHMFHLSSMLTNGVPVEFPDLDFVFMEAGVGWIPYFMRRYDHEYAGKRRDAPKLGKKPPSEYIERQFYFTSQPIEGADDPQYLGAMIRLFGGQERLLFSSDYPHPDFDYTNQLAKSLRSQFEADELQNIYGETARTVFDI